MAYRCLMSTFTDKFSGLGSKWWEKKSCKDVEGVPKWVMN